MEFLFESFQTVCKFFQTIWRRKKFRAVQKVSRISKILSRLFGNFTDFWDCMETFQMFAKLLIPSGNFSVYVKKNWRLSRNFSDWQETFCLETLQSVRKLSRLSKPSPDCQESFQSTRKLFRLSRNYSVQCPGLRAKNSESAKASSTRQLGFWDFGASAGNQAEKMTMVGEGSDSEDGSFWPGRGNILVKMKMVLLYNHEDICDVDKPCFSNFRIWFF